MTDIKVQYCETYDPATRTCSCFDTEEIERMTDVRIIKRNDSADGGLRYVVLCAEHGTVAITSKLLRADAQCDAHLEDAHRA